MSAASPSGAASSEISRSLTAFYGAGIPPARFLGSLLKGSVQQFPQEDVERALSELRSRDPLLRRTVGLASAAILRHGPVQPAVKQWLVAVLQSEFEGSWSDTATRRVFDRYRVAIGSKNVSESRRAFNAMRLGLLLLHREDKLDPVEVVTEVERLATTTRGRSPSGQGRSAIELFLRAAELNRLKRVYAALQLWLDEARGARNRVHEAQEGRDRAEERLLKTQGEVNRLTGELEEVRAALRLSESQVSDLTDALKVAENNRIHDLHETKGRMRRFIREGVLPRLHDAAEALKMAPPRVEPALERLSVVEDQISTEDAWLTLD